MSEKSGSKQQHDLTDEEVEEANSEALPDREAMSLREIVRKRGVSEDVLDKALDYRRMASPHN